MNLKKIDVAKRKDQIQKPSGKYSAPSLLSRLEKIPMMITGKKEGCCQTKGECYDFGTKPRRIDPEINRRLLPRQQQLTKRAHSELFFLRHICV